MNDKMIHDYLEGELSTAEQDLLFAELNNSPRMREELDYQMKLNKFMEMDRNASNTPAELTASLFNKLNYSIPLANNAKLISSRRQYFWRYSVAMLLLLFISVPVGYMIYNNYQDSNLGDKTIINKSGTTLNSNEISRSNSWNNSNLDMAQAENMQAEGGFSNINNSNISKGKSLDSFEPSDAKSKSRFNSSIDNGNLNNVDNTSNFANYNKDLIAQINPVDFINNNKDYTFVNLNSNLNSLNSTSSGINLNPIIGDLFSILSNQNFEFNINIKNNVNQYPPSTLNVSNNIYDNIDLSLWYNFADGLKAGVEFGRESFNQTFTTIDGLVYHQIPTLNYIGVGVRYSAYQYELPMETIPYLQLKASATTIGPIFNMQTGLNIASYSKVSIRLGLEYSSLLYNVNSNIYNSGKVNFVGGFVYSF